MEPRIVQLTPKRFVTTQTGVSNNFDKNSVPTTMVSRIESDQLCPVNVSSLSEAVKSPTSPINYATLPCTEEDTGKMKPLLALSTSVNLNLPNSPPAYSRMPPDGHEFPQTYQEIDPNAHTFELTSPPTKCPSYADEFYAKKPAVYTDVVNEAKLLDVERSKMPEKSLKTDDSSIGSKSSRHSQSWRNDERSERSVKDKIAMFSNVIQKATPAFPRAAKCRADDVVDHAASKALSKSVFSVNALGHECYSDKMAARFKSKHSYCQRSVESTNPININRTQSSIDLTLFSSSCSSAYSSCSPDSSLSPMSSPSYTIGSASTLPRKHNKSHPATNGATDRSSSLSAASPSSCDAKHTALTRATSFTGTTALHCRSQSLVDVLHTQTRPPGVDDHRKDSLTTLIEQRRRTMSKLRGLVIPEKSGDEVAALKPIIDLPEIRSKPVLNGGSGAALNHQPNRYVPKPTKHDTAAGTFDCSWKSVLNAVDIPKYSPAFKRKTLTVYGVCSSASSLSSSLNSSREELRDTKKSTAPAKPPRNCNTQLVYGPTVYKSMFGKQPESGNKQESKANYQISRSDILKLQEDSDNDSAVSSSRSSLCQEYSPPSSPSLNGGDYDARSNERVSADSPSQSSSRTLRRTLSSETNVSLTSSVSTLTSGSSQASSSSGDAFREQSKRVLKAESVEAINRKNVLSSAKYSCGQDFKVGSPLIKDVFDGGQRFSEDFEHRNWFEYDKFTGNAQPDDVKVAYLEIQDGEESDYSAKENEHENSSSVDTDEALDKSIDSTDSLCGNYRSEYTIDPSKKSDSDDLMAFGSMEPSGFPETTKSDDECARKSQSEGEADGKRDANAVNGQVKKSVNDIKKTFENNERTTASRGKQTPPNHLRMSSTDSTTSEESFPLTASHGLNTNLLKEQQFGSITSLASSTSIISQQELQQLIDEANQTLEETGSGEHDLMVIILHRDTVMSSIGITLAGGADYEAKEITVHKILIGSPADKDGRIQKGDRILSINGRNMKGVTHREALSILKAPRPEVVLVVSRWKADGQSMPASTPIEDPLVATFKNTLRPPRIPEMATDCDTKNCLSSTSTNCGKPVKGPVTSVTLIKEGGGLGFSLEGGKDSPFGDLPLTIKKIFTGGCAAKSGALAAGDELISLNGVDVTSMSRTEAWNMMKRLSDGQVVLNIRQPVKE